MWQVFSKVKADHVNVVRSKKELNNKWTTSHAKLLVELAFEFHELTRDQTTLNPQQDNGVRQCITCPRAA